MAFHGIFQRLTQLGFVRHVVFYRVVVEPVALVVRTDLAVFTPQVTACRELFDGAADRHQGFHFRRNVEVAVFIVAHVQRDNTDVVAANQVGVFFAVVQGEGKHTLQVVQKLGTFLLIQRQDHFTVGPGLERVAVAVLGAQRLVVIDLTVDSQRVRFFLVIQRLCTGVDVNNRQTFVSQNCFVTGVNAGPVRAAMAHQAGQFECLFTQFARVSFNIQYAKN